MFNVRNKIYVALPEEINIVQHRVIILHPDYVNVGFEFAADPNDKTTVGVLAKHASFDDMVAADYNGLSRGFFDFLQTETDLIIVCSPDEYAKIFAVMLMELAEHVNMSDQHIDLIAELQDLKEYFAGSAVNSLVDAVNAAKAMSTVGAVTDNDIMNMPFELVYVLYKWGYISNTIANVKVNAVAEQFLRGQISDIADSAKQLIALTPNILRLYLNDNTITTPSEIINAIEGNATLRSILVTNDYAINDDVLRFCETFINNNDLDYDSDPVIDLAEFNFYVTLYTTRDIDSIAASEYNLIRGGFVSARADKFNSLLYLGA